MATKLNQIIAVQPSTQSDAKRRETDLYRLLEKTQLFSGLSRTYSPKDEEGDQLPPESTLVQRSVESVLTDLASTQTRFWDVTLTKERANTEARADIVVDGESVLADVPVTYLLFLEKQVTDVITFFSKLPVLDPSVKWSLDENTGEGVYRSEPVETVRTKKVPRNWVKAEATKEHPAQVEIFHEDVVVGNWKKVDFSGAIPATRKVELTKRAEALLAAIKFAREEANSREITDQKASAKVFDYLLG